MTRRTTYDKLANACNAFEAEGWTVQVDYVGGRDYNIVLSRDVGEIVE